MLIMTCLSSCVLLAPIIAQGIQPITASVSSACLTADNVSLVKLPHLTYAVVCEASCSIHTSSLLTQIAAFLHICFPLAVFLMKVCVVVSFVVSLLPVNLHYSPAWKTTGVISLNMAMNTQGRKKKMCKRLLRRLITRHSYRNVTAL